MTVFAPQSRRTTIPRTVLRLVLGAFFIAVFPGNISQLVTLTDSFGLNTDLARSTRLLFQPVLVIWALWSTGAWLAWRRHRAQASVSSAVPTVRRRDRDGDES